MHSLPAALEGVLQPFAPVFSRPIWKRVQVLLAGAILSPSRRTVAQALRVVGLAEEISAWRASASGPIWRSPAPHALSAGPLFRGDARSRSPAPTGATPSPAERLVRETAAHLQRRLGRGPTRALAESGFLALRVPDAGHDNPTRRLGTAS